MAGRHFHRLTADVLLSVRGIGAMLRWGAQRDDLALALAVFRAHDGEARPGQVSAYELILANAGPIDVTAQVLIDVYRRDDPSHPDGHYVFFEKTVLARRRRAESVTITYDWRSQAEFVVDGVGLAADALWRGPCDRPGTYDVHAVLLDPGAAARQRLRLVQELA